MTNLNTKYLALGDCTEAELRDRKRLGARTKSMLRIGLRQPLPCIVGALATVIGASVALGCGEDFTCEDNRDCAPKGGNGGRGGFSSNAIGGTDEVPGGASNSGGLGAGGSAPTGSEGGANDVGTALAGAGAGGLAGRTGGTSVTTGGRSGGSANPGAGGPATGGSAGLGAGGAVAAVGGTAPTSGAAGGPASGGATAAGQGGDVSGATGGASAGGSAGGVAPIAGATSGGAGPCLPGSQQCRDNVPQLCSASGEWQDQAPCIGSTPVCEEAACICPAGALQCKADGVTPQFCASSGVWQDRTACSGETPVCNGAGVCGACKVGDKKCEQATPYVCSESGTWQAQPACSGATPFCAVGSCTATCPGNGGPAMKLLPEGYCIDTTEVTREQYQIWLASGPVASAATQIADCAWNDSFVPGTDAKNDWPPTRNSLAPVVFIDWCDAYAYCAAVGKHLCGRVGGGPISYDEFTANPNASEWISACSSHGEYDYTYGDTYTEAVCNVNTASGNYVASLSGCQSPVAAYAGVYDLSGNVQEWEDNCTAGQAMTAYCTVRGGAFALWDTESMCTSIMSGRRTDTSSYVGFRCCSS